MRIHSLEVVASLLILAACGGGGSDSTGPSGPAGKVGPPAKIVVYSGDEQTGNRGTTLPFPLCTNVYDANNHLLLGVDVTYTVATGGGSIEGPATVATDGRGIATSGLWTLGPNGGAQTVTATAASGVTVTFRAVAN